MPRPLHAVGVHTPPEHPPAMVKWLAARGRKPRPKSPTAWPPRPSRAVPKKTTDPIVALRVARSLQRRQADPASETEPTEWLAVSADMRRRLRSAAGSPVLRNQRSSGDRVRRSTGTDRLGRPIPLSTRGALADVERLRNRHVEPSPISNALTSSTFPRKVR